MIPFHIIHLSEADSTNQYLENLSDKGNSKEGYVVYADRQSSGKGQGENKWESEPGKNLTVSIDLRPQFLKAKHQFYLNQAISLAVCDTIDALIQKKSNIKWPNDIYVDDQKITGILIENCVMGEYLSQSIVGIGININQAKFVSDAPNPISVFQITGKENKIDEVLNMLLQNIENRYRSLKDDMLSQEKEYHDRLYARDRQRDFMLKGKKISGKISGVNAFGQLIIQGETNQWICNQQEIKLLPMNP